MHTYKVLLANSVVKFTPSPKVQATHEQLNGSQCQAVSVITVSET